MGCSSLINQQNNHGIMEDHNQEQQNDHSDLYSSSSNNSSTSTLSDLVEDATSNGHSHHLQQLGSSSTSNSPLHEMSSLFQHLPLKRGLSKHFQGKSQSFTSLSEVRSLEDLAKPENPYKKLKTLKGYCADHKDKVNSSSFSRTCSSKPTNLISSSPKKNSMSRGSYCSSSTLISHANECGNSSNSRLLFGNKPPISPQKATTY